MGKSVDNSEARQARVYEVRLGDELRGERATLGKTLLDVQRDLRIKAAYIAAIEDAQPEIIHNPGFVPGYVRSYARYLNLDAEAVYQRFCSESGFSVRAARPSAVPGGGKPARGAAPNGTSGGFRPDFPMAEGRVRGLPAIPFSAIGSLLVLVGLVAGLGYGGWTVLQNIQRVQFAPVDEVPVAVARIDSLAAPEIAALEEPTLADLASPVAAAALADLYRQQELEVPILVPRDGPIAALDPDKIGLLARPAVAIQLPEAAQSDPLQGAITAAVAASQDLGPPVLAAVTQVPLTVLAERAAWVRVYLENGTIIFERILEKGETYSPPQDVGAPLIWAGNAGSVYVRIGAALHGPLGSGTKAVRDVVLDPAAIAERFSVVEDVPEVISQTLGDLSRETEAPVAIQ